MKKQKGFTLVELLGVIILLGILSIIAIASVRNILKSSKEKYYKTQHNLVILAAKDYFSTNPSRLPRIDGQTEKVLLKTLIDQKYIDPIFDQKKQACNQNLSYVSVIRNGKNKYVYKSVFVCPNYEGESS